MSFDKFCFYKVTGLTSGKLNAWYAIVTPGDISTLHITWTKVNNLWNWWK